MSHLHNIVLVSTNYYSFTSSYYHTTTLCTMHVHDIFMPLKFGVECSGLIKISRLSSVASVVVVCSNLFRIFLGRYCYIIYIKHKLLQNIPSQRVDTTIAAIIYLSLLQRVSTTVGYILGQQLERILLCLQSAICNCGTY